MIREGLYPAAGSMRQNLKMPYVREIGKVSNRGFIDKNRVVLRDCLFFLALPKYRHFGSDLRCL